MQKNVSKNHTTTAAKVTAELNIHLETCLHKNSLTRASQIQHPCTVAIAKPLITEIDAKRRKRWCDDHKTWTSDDLKYVIWSDEVSFTKC